MALHGRTCLPAVREPGSKSRRLLSGSAYITPARMRRRQPLFNHHVGAGKQHRWDFQAERLRRLQIDNKLAPRGEAENIHRGGGRYISIIGNNDLFHNASDRGADAVDVKIIERFAKAFGMVARLLASG